MQGSVIEQRHSGEASSEREPGCETPDGPDWRIVVTDLPPAITSVVLIERRIVVTTADCVARWAQGSIAAARQANAIAGGRNA